MDPITPASQSPQDQMTPTPASAPIPVPMASEPVKYKVFQSIKEVMSSIKKNPVTTLLPIGLGIIISIVFSFITVFALALVGTNAAMILNDVVVVVAVAFGISVVQLIVLTTLTNAYALALRDSYDGEQKAASTYLKDGFKLLWRAFLATMLYTLAVLGGVLVLLVPAFIATRFDSLPTIVTILFYVLGIASIAWIIVAMLRFALSVQVAIFEPHTPIAKVLSRSNHLMTGGGQWFIVKASLLLIATYILIAVVTGNGMGGSGSSVNGQGELNVAGTLLTSLLTPFVYGVSTMLYRNRAAVRK